MKKYETVCPSCKEDNKLEVTEGFFYCNNMMLSEDGYDFCDAEMVGVERAFVSCKACEALFEIEELEID